MIIHLRWISRLYFQRSSTSVIIPYQKFFIDSGKEDIGKIWRGNSESKKVGEEGNETGTHHASKTNHVEWKEKTDNKMKIRDFIVTCTLTNDELILSYFTDINK